MPNEITSQHNNEPIEMSTLPLPDTGSAARAASVASTTRAPGPGVLASLLGRMRKKSNSMNSAEPGGLFHTLVTSTAGVAAATARADSHASFFQTERRFNAPAKSGEFLGTVKKDSGGRLGADDYLIDSLLQFAQTPTPGSTRTLRGIEMHGDEARLVFSMDPKLEQCHADFSELCRVSDIFVRKHAATRNTVMLDEESVPILIPVMLKVMLEGRAAFKPDAKLSLSGREGSTRTTTSPR